MKIKNISIVSMLLLIWACSSDEVNPDYLKALEEAQKIPISNEPDKDQLYEVKAGTIVFEVWTGFNDSLEGPRADIVHFDDYGIKERVETYNMDGSLHLVQFNDGQKTIILNPNGMVAHEVTHEKYIGTQTRFAIAVKNSGSGAYDWGKEIVAGKECDVFYSHGDNSTIKNGGWGNIVLLYDFRSDAWGDYSRRAVEITEGAVDPTLFQIPKEYTFKAN